MLVTDKELAESIVIPALPRTIIAMSMYSWGKCDCRGTDGLATAIAIKTAIAKLRAAGGSTAKGKMLLISAPHGAWINGNGATCWEGNDERPYYIDRQGNRLADQTKPFANY